jgi:hypothetical protein
MAITIDELRALTGDTGTPPIMDDAQYNVAIAIESLNYYDAAAIACTSLAGIFATKVKLAAGPVSLDNQQKYEHYLELAQTYRQFAREGKGAVNGGGATTLSLATPILTGISISDMESVRDDPDRYNSNLYRGMHDNPPEYTEDEFDGEVP